MFKSVVFQFVSIIDKFKSTITIETLFSSSNSKKELKLLYCDSHLVNKLAKSFQQASFSLLQ